jgi:hypothetical protein
LREYNKALAPFQLFSVNHRISQITVSPDTIQEMPNAMGCCLYDSDAIKLRMPNYISQMQLPSLANTIAHEIAHFTVQEYYEGNVPDAVSWQWGNRLVHYGSNMALVRNDFSYWKYLKYWTPIFYLQYGFPRLEFWAFDVSKLVRDRAYIIDQIDRGLAPTGKDSYT